MDMDSEIQERYYYKTVTNLIIGIVVIVFLLVTGHIGYDAMMFYNGYEYKQIPTGATQGAWVKIPKAD
jgi:hypothetical protein